MLFPTFEPEPEPQRGIGFDFVAASGKKDGPIMRVPMTESEGPTGGYGDTAVLFPRKVGGGLGPRFRTKWHRGDKP